MTDQLVPGVDYEPSCCAICGTIGECVNPQQCSESYGEWQGEDER